MQDQLIDLQAPKSHTVAREFLALRQQARRWTIAPWVGYLNKVLGKLHLPYDLKKRFDHRADMVSLEQVANFELLIGELLDDEVPGDFVELGCYTGSTAAIFSGLLSAARSDREFHVFDRFDIELGNVRNVRQAFEQNLRRARVPIPHIHAGDVMHTVPDELPETIAFAHIDLGFGARVEENVSVVRHVLEAIYPRLVPHGIIVLMDYHVPGVTVNGNDSNPGVRIAADAFFADKPEPIRLLYGGPCSHAFVRKLG